MLSMPTAGGVRLPDVVSHTQPPKRLRPPYQLCTIHTTPSLSPSTASTTHVLQRLLWPEACMNLPQSRSPKPVKMSGPEGLPTPISEPSSPTLSHNLLDTRTSLLQNATARLRHRALTFELLMPLEVLAAIAALSPSFMPLEHQRCQAPSESFYACYSPRRTT